MKIKYKFVDGTVAEVEVDESIGTVIAESRRLEGNLARKESWHGRLRMTEGPPLKYFYQVAGDSYTLLDSLAT